MSDVVDKALQVLVNSEEIHIEDMERIVLKEKLEWLDVADCPICATKKNHEKCRRTFVDVVESKGKTLTEVVRDVFDNDDASLYAITTLLNMMDGDKNAENFLLYLVERQLDCNSSFEAKLRNLLG